MHCNRREWQEMCENMWLEFREASAVNLSVFVRVAVCRLGEVCVSVCDSEC